MALLIVFILCFIVDCYLLLGLLSLFRENILHQCRLWCCSVIFRWRRRWDESGLNSCFLLFLCIINGNMNWVLSLLFFITLLYKYFLLLITI
jgi:hypothetical protein